VIAFPRSILDEEIAFIEKHQDFILQTKYWGVLKVPANGPPSYMLAYSMHSALLARQKATLIRDSSAFGHRNIGIHAVKSLPRFNPDSVVDGLPQPLLATEIFFGGLHGNTSQQKLNLL
jgi:hypothetical protein